MIDLNKYGDLLNEKISNVDVRIWDVQSKDKKVIHEIETAIGAGIGAGIGALGASSIWAIKRLQLKKKMDACNGDPRCMEAVQNEIDSLRKKALLGGAAATVGGAGLGYGVNVGYNIKDSNSIFNKAQKEAEEAEKDKRNSIDQYLKWKKALQTIGYDPQKGEMYPSVLADPAQEAEKNYNIANIRKKRALDDMEIESERNPWIR